MGFRSNLCRFERFMGMNEVRSNRCEIRFVTSGFWRNTVPMRAAIGVWYSSQNPKSQTNRSGRGRSFDRQQSQENNHRVESQDSFRKCCSAINFADAPCLIARSPILLCNRLYNEGQKDQNCTVLGSPTSTLIDTPLGIDWSHIQIFNAGSFFTHRSIIYSQIVLITRLCSSSN